MVQQTFTFFYSIVNDNSPKYLKAELSQPKVYNYSLRSDGVFERSYVETQRSGNTFFLYCIREWNELHVSIRTVTTLSQFKNKLIKCIRPPKRSTFKIDDILGIKLITSISLGFSICVNIGIITIFLSVQFALVGLNLKQLNISSYAGNASVRFGLICSTMHANYQDRSLIYYPTKLLTKLILYTFNDRSNQLILLGAMTFIRLPEHFKIDDPSP